MKKLIFILLCCITIANAQNHRVGSIEITPDGLNGFLIIETEGSQDILYNHAINWVKKTFQDPEEVILSTINNEYLRIQTHFNNGVEFQENGYLVGSDLKTDIEMHFKDGKIKIEFINWQVGTYPYFYSIRGGAFDLSFYNNSGKPRKRSEGVRIGANKKFNEITLSLKRFIEAPKSDW